MQNCPNWKVTLRREIYRQNFIAITSNLKQTSTRDNIEIYLQNSKWDLVWQVHQHLKKGQSKQIQSNESALPSFQRHPKLSFYIPIRYQVCIPTDIEYIFDEYLGKGKIKSKRVEQMLKFFKVQDQQMAISQKWSFLLQKYICPIDAIQRIELYVKLLKFGTSKLQSFILFKYPHLEPQILLKSIITMSRYFQQPKKIQSRFLVQKNKLTQHFCQYCNVYNCINHLPSPQTLKITDQNLISRENFRSKQKEDYRIDSLIKLLAEIQNLYLNRNNKFKNNKIKPCSSDCYHNMNYRDIESLYRYLFIHKQPFDSVKLKELKSIFGYNPCSISKAFQSKCNKVLILILLQSQNNLSNLADICQSEFLKRKDKYELAFSSEGCECRKGDCSSNKCYCFKNKKECSQKCRCQSVLAGLFGSPQFCHNQNIFKGINPHLKVGFSEKDQNSLGLFTKTIIRSQQVVFWISGKLHIESIWSDFEQWFLNKKGEKACNLINGNSNCEILGGKCRFIRHRNAKQANLKQTVRQVNGIQYIVLLASRDLQVQQELFLACKCCLFQ